MREREIKSLLDKLNKRARSAERKCLFDNCQSTSIESHLLQKNGIISEIAENNHVWELGQDSFKNELFYFKNIGINEAFSFPGFCNTHDNKIFKEVENGNVVYSDYRTQLLFSYRAVMNEMRKKQILVDYYDRILKSLTLKLYTSDHFLQGIQMNKQGQIEGINDEIYYEKFFLSNIANNTLRDFKFITFELPRTEICSSAVFTYETTQEIEAMMKFQSWKREKPLTEIYFNFLPLSNKSVVILGCLQERVSTCWDYIMSFKADTPEKSLKKISNLLLNQVENWLCSNKLYLKNFKARSREIIKITHISLHHQNERRELDFNLFDT